MRKIQFAEFELDLELFKLEKGGHPIKVGPRALDLLVYLIENRDRVVDRNELLDRVWESAALSRSSIPTCIRELRIALEDDANDPKLIETCRGRGYRFIGRLSGLRVDDEIDKPFGVNIPFVGRCAELEEMNACMNVVATDARCQLMLIQGEAGIGKTRLLTEFVANVGADFASYIAVSPGFDGAPGFWPWTQILREALADTEKHNPKLAMDVETLAGVFPEIRNTGNRKLASLDRFSILSLWTRAIRGISNGRPLLLAFEDIHRADIDTISLLARLCEELSNDPVLLIATRRPRATTDRGAKILNELAGMQACTNLDIGPLSANQIAAMLDPLIDDRQALGEALRYRTSGNAFYATSLIRILGQKAIAQSVEDIISRLPPNAQEIVAHQLSDLPASTRRALEVAAVAGMRFQISSLAIVLSQRTSELIEHLDSAKRAWFIVESGSDHVFTHSLLRDALYQTINSLDRRKLHLALANAIEQVAGRHTRTAEIAEHLLRALPLSNAQETRKIACEAGSQAAARFAYSKAQFFFRIALDIAERDSDVSSTSRCRIMLSLAEAQLFDGDRDGAYSTLREAAILARTEGDAELLASCALQLSPDFLAIEIGSYDTKLISLLRESLEHLPGNCLSIRSQVLARLSLALLWSQEAQESENLAIEALRIARDSADSTALNAALAARADSLQGPDRVVEKMEVTYELQRTVRTRNAMSDTMMQHIRIVSTNLELGKIREVDAAISACDRIAGEMNIAQYLWYPMAFKAMRELMKGEFSKAGGLGQMFRELGDRNGDANVRNSHAGQTGYILIEKDRADLALPAISRMAESFPLVRSWRAGVGYLQLMSSQLEMAQRTLDSFDDRDIRLLFREAGGCAGVAFLAEISASVGSTKHQGLLYDLCSTAHSNSAVLGFGIVYFGCFHRYAGILAHKLGLASEAIEHLELAIDIERKREAVVIEAHTSLDLACTLISSSGKTSDVSKLVESVDATLRDTESARLARRLSQIRNDGSSINN